MALFAFDIDGTLYDHKSQSIPQSALDTIKSLKHQGHIVGVSTGRNKRQLEKAVDPALFDFIMLVNGGYVEIDGKKVLSTPFSYEQKNTLVSLFEGFGYEYGITTYKNLHAPHPMSDNVQRVIQTYQVITPEQTSDIRPLEVYQFSLYEPLDVYDSIKHLSKDYQIHSLGDYGYDLVIPGVNKGYTLQKLAKHYQIDMKDTIAFGDSDNDTLMLKMAGKGVAMNNGTKAAKCSADMITTDVFNHGIYEGVKKLGYIK